MTIEAEVQKIKNAVRELKGSMPVAGSKINFIVEQSQSFAITIPAHSQKTVTIKYQTAKTGEIFANLMMTDFNRFQYFATEPLTAPQTGDGSVNVSIIVSTGNNALTGNITAMFTGVDKGTWSVAVI